MEAVDVTTQMAAEKTKFGRRLPDGTRTARAKEATKARQLARLAAGRYLAPEATEEEAE
jgi:hypothetical protein